MLCSWHHVGMTQDELKEALQSVSLAIVAAISKVHITTLRRIRDGKFKASHGTIVRVQPVLARLNRNETKEPK